MSCMAFTKLYAMRVRYETEKGEWRMPWLTEAMKDVISCDKPRGDANDL